MTTTIVNIVDIVAPFLLSRQSGGGDGGRGGNLYLIRSFSTSEGFLTP